MKGHIHTQACPVQLHEVFAEYRRDRETGLGGLGRVVAGEGHRATRIPESRLGWSLQEWGGGGGGGKMLLCIVP